MKNDRGAALLVAMMATTLLAAFGFSLAVLSSIEARVAGNYASAENAMDAAEAALELAIHELRALADWNAVAAGGVRSTLVDGAPGGTRVLSDGATIDLDGLTAALGDSRWRVFSYGRLAGFLPAPSHAYVVVWAAADRHGRPDTLELRCDAFDAGGVRRMAETVVTRSAILSWKLIR